MTFTAEQKFDKANENFKKIYKLGQQDEKINKPNKYKWLPNWTYGKSKYFLQEHEQKNKNKKVYKRGAIVNVDFGINVGQELSGNHFAIILNKSDNPYNDKLTVIPLTSHYHKRTVKLDNTILNLSSDTILTKSIENLTVTYASFVLMVSTYRNHGIETDTANEIIKTFLKKQQHDDPELQKKYQTTHLLTTY